MVQDSTSCRRCGRKLTDSGSIAKGIGPVCEGKEELEGNVEVEERSD